MWIQHLEDGAEMEVRPKMKNGKLVQELRPLAAKGRREGVDVPKPVQEGEANMSELVRENDAAAEKGDWKKLNLTPLQAVVELVRRGRKELLPRLRELLAAQPEVFQRVGNLGLQAQQAWADMIAGPDDLLRESLVLFAEEMKQDLVGPKASRLEKVAAERIAACWVEVEYHRAWLVQRPEADGTKVGQLHEKRFEAAHRRMERAMTTLANIKKLLPRTIQVEIRQPAAVQQPQPIFTGPINGDQPKMDGVQAMRESLANGTTKPAINGMNGYHNRISGLMEPLTTEN
jgi:hypothetical protein